MQLDLNVWVVLLHQLREGQVLRDADVVGLEELVWQVVRLDRVEVDQVEPLDAELRECDPREASDPTTANDRGRTLRVVWVIPLTLARVFNCCHAPSYGAGHDGVDRTNAHPAGCRSCRGVLRCGQRNQRQPPRTLPDSTAQT